MSKQNKDLVRRVIDEVMNKKKVDVFDQICAPSYVWHGPSGEEVKGIQGAKGLANMYLSAFPDARITIDDQLAEGDKVVTRWTARGTHKGDLQGIKPTGKKVMITGMIISRIAGGKIAEEWEAMDTMGMMQQLGVVPAAGQAQS